MDYEVVDNFLLDDELQYLKDLIIKSGKVPFYIRDTVVVDRDQPNWKDLEDTENQHWNYMGVHTAYHQVPKSEYWKMFEQMFFMKFNDVELVKTPVRVKINWYPHTETLREHGKHKDSWYSHKGAVFMLNTYDGFTRMANGDKIESVENRIVFFDPINLHNSSTTTNAKGRYTINFNWF